MPGGVEMCAVGYRAPVWWGKGTSLQWVRGARAMGCGVCRQWSEGWVGMEHRGLCSGAQCPLAMGMQDARGESMEQEVGCAGDGVWGTYATGHRSVPTWVRGVCGMGQEMGVTGHRDVCAMGYLHNGTCADAHAMGCKGVRVVGCDDKHTVGHAENMQWGRDINVQWGREVCVPGRCRQCICSGTP